MSWLLVAFVPGLLMLATFGLGRLEASLDDDTVSPVDVVAVVERAKADCAKPAARTGAVQTYPLVDDEYVAIYRGRVVGDSTESLPARAYLHHGSNPEYQQTRHAFRV